MTAPIPAWVDGVLQPMGKMQVHIDGLKHKAVSVFVMRGSETLLQQRAMTKYHTPGHWANACCTHPDWNEASADCAIRRMREELGIVGLTPDFRGRIEYKADVGGGLTEHEVVDVYRADAKDGVPILPDPGEVMATRWIGLDALRSDIRSDPDRYTPWLRIYIEQHGHVILGSDRVTHPA